ncbi:MAG TPA: clostripain-related cysteine peptidase [Nitrososphaeraceae archaeon]
MVTYMAGDNDLSEYGVRDIKEMEETGVGEETYCLVEFDSEGPQPNGFNGTIRYEITKKDPRTGKAYRKVIERFEDRDSGDKKTLVKCLKWAKEDYNSEHYLVNIWNHGKGIGVRKRLSFLSDRKGAALRGRAGTLFTHKKNLNKLTKGRAIAFDYSTGNNLDMRELSAALQEAGFSDSDKKIDILGFDACLMNMLEVGYEMSKHAHFMVGSEELEPFEGWPYALDLKSMNLLRIDVPKLAKELVKNYRQFYSHPPYDTDEYWPVTQSAIDLSHISELAKSVDEFASAITSSLRANYDAALVKISNLRENVQRYAIEEDYDQYVDVGDLALLFRDYYDDSAVKTTASGVIKNLKKAILAEINLGDDVENSHGLTIWFPETAHKYHINKKSYESLAMTRMFGSWNKFLNTYHRSKGRDLKRGEF